MHQLKYNELLVQVENESHYKTDSNDNFFTYESIIPNLNQTQFEPSSKHGIKIFLNNNLLRSTLLLGFGGATGIHKTSFLIDNDKILICCSDSIFCLNLPDLKLEWITQADSATCFQIFKLNDGYVIHGELEITKLKTDGTIEWAVGGADIFVTQHGTDDFKITPNWIEAKDWNNDLYKIGFDGKIISDTVKKKK